MARRGVAHRVDASAKSKYGAKPTTIDGIRFASKAESRRYAKLKLLEKAGEIYSLTLQPRFVLRAEDGEPIGHYVADFQYNQRCYGGSRRVVEDVKGFDTPLSRWKRKHVAAQYGITVEIIK